MAILICCSHNPPSLLLDGEEPLKQSKLKRNHSIYIDFDNLITFNSKLIVRLFLHITWSEEDLQLISNILDSLEML